MSLKEEYEFYCFKDKMLTRLKELAESTKDKFKFESLCVEDIYKDRKFIMVTATFDDPVILETCFNCSYFNIRTSTKKKFDKEFFIRKINGVKDVIQDHMSYSFSDDKNTYNVDTVKGCVMCNIQDIGLINIGPVILVEITPKVQGWFY